MVLSPRHGKFIYTSGIGKDADFCEPMLVTTIINEGDAVPRSSNLVAGICHSQGSVVNASDVMVLKETIIFDEDATFDNISDI